MADTLDRQKMLRKVKGLLDKAHGTTNEHEKEAFFAKADELMRKFTIEEFMLDALDTSRDRTPEVRIFERRVTGDWEFDDNLMRLFQVLCTHVGVKIVYRASPTRVVGWSQDLEFLDLLYTSLEVDIKANMKPKWNPAIPEGENLHNFKSCGFKWEDIWYERQKAMGTADGPWQRKHGVRWTNVYKKWADATGTDRQMSSNLQHFRSDFGYGYVQEVSDRLRKIRETREGDTEGVALVLRDRKSDLEKFIEDNWPTPPPPPPDPNAKPQKLPKMRYRSMNTGAYRAGRAQGAKADLGQKGVEG